MNSNGKIALITGAGSGIGRAAAIALLNDGYSIAITGRRIKNLQETEEMSGASSEKILAVAGDVGSVESVKNLFATVVNHFGRLDVLFNNAGIGAPAVNLEELSYEQWKSVVDINLTGVFLCTQEAFRIMKVQSPKGGRIINNGSVSAMVPRPNSAPYTATKHGVTGLTRSASLDGRKYNIACGQIDIGNAETEMTQRMSQGVMQANGEVSNEPVMDVDNVAKAILYMANLPLDANVQFITVMATSMPFIGRG